MKIILTRSDVLKILAKHFNLEIGSILSPKGDTEIFWEGNDEAIRIAKKKEITEIGKIK